MRKLIATSIFLGLFVLGFSQTNNPKYVFLFIGDGMGVNQIYSSELYLSANPGVVKDTQLLINTFPVASNMTTYSADTYVTGSAAAGTAMSTGLKTNNGVLGKSPDLQTNYETISVKAKRAGYKVGVLSSVMIDHATPASFYAHQNSRNMYYEIGMELPNYEIDYFGGGGFHYLKGENGDQPDTYENAISKGYIIADSKDEIAALKQGSDKVIAINPDRYEFGEFHWAIDREEDELSLADFTQKGIEVLDNDKGFFMMVEGGKIDWACHGNDAASMIHEVLAFNDAVQVAYEFYKEKPEETLIIVTADHETGSLFAGINYKMKPELIRHQKISEQEFERKISELKESEEQISFEHIKELVETDFGLGNNEFGLALSDEELITLNDAYKFEFKNKGVIDPDDDYLDVKTAESIADVAINILNKKAGIGWGSNDHSSMPVPVRVIGAGQEEFAKYFDNTELPKKIQKLMGM